MDLTIGHRKLMQYSWGDLPINRTNCNQKLDNKNPRLGVVISPWGFSYTHYKELPSAYD